ncbi:MAG: transposase [Phenylobacterium sp.]|jgi:transposase
MLAFTGIDVSKEKLDLGWLRDPTTGKKKNKTIKNTKKGHEQVAEWLVKNTKQKPENIVVVLEPTNVYHEGLMYFLNEKGFKIFLANPAKAKQYAKSIGVIHKTDKMDSIILAYYGQAMQINHKYWIPESSEARALKAMMRRLEALEKDRQRELNRQDAFEFNPASERVTQSLQEIIEALESEIAALESAIDQHIESHLVLKKNRELLETIAGIGPVMSREFTYLFAAKLFENSKQVAAYLGLIPQLNESGKFVGRTTMSKMGPARFRAKLYMAAVVASSHNPDIKSQKERLLTAGKTKMQALGAAMRKLAQICFGVVKHQTEYQPQVS